MCLKAPAVVSPKCSHRVVFQFSLMKVGDVGAHAVQEVLRVRDQHKDSLEPGEGLSVMSKTHRMFGLIER